MPVDFWLIVLTIFATLSLAVLGSAGHARLRCIPAHLIGANRLALWLYALPFLPGVMLHEISHAVAAFVLNVDVEGFSLRPLAQDGMVILGYVRHGKTGVLRQVLIGLAPLAVGTFVLLLIGILGFDVLRAQEQAAAGDWPRAVETLISGFGSWKGWVAAYFIFAVSANMFPSPPDVRACLPVGVFLLLVLSLALLAGVGNAGLGILARPVNTLFNWLLLVFGLALIVDFPVVFLLTATYEMVSRHFPQT